MALWSSYDLSADMYFVVSVILPLVILTLQTFNTTENERNNW